MTTLDSAYFEQIKAVNAAMSEPSTPSELAQDEISRHVRDAYTATSELLRLRCDPVAGRFVSEHEGELYSVKARIDLLLSEIRDEQNLEPIPATARVVRFRR